ncbi:MAG TPA: Ig-like domain-containing protein [Candidatus Limnocylindrales bacterium]|nr:Ig-like domain-containing protein [Candidatus Limnocylindrales bacterium]
MRRRTTLVALAAIAGMAMALSNAAGTAVAGPAPASPSSVPPVGDWPIGAITSPLNNNPTYTAPATIPISAFAATAPGSTVTKVEFWAYQWVNQQLQRHLISIDTTAPYSAVWSNVAPGSYQLILFVEDSAGRRAYAAPAVALTVVP